MQNKEHFACKPWYRCIKTDCIPDSGQVEPLVSYKRKIPRLDAHHKNSTPKSPRVTDVQISQPAVVPLWTMNMRKITTQTFPSFEPKIGNVSPCQCNYIRPNEWDNRKHLGRLTNCGGQGSVWPDKLSQNLATLKTLKDQHEEAKIRNVGKQIYN